MLQVFRNHEEDLAELERVLPRFSESIDLRFTTRLRMQLRRVKSILSHVRSNDGPAIEVDRAVDEGEHETSITGFE